MCMKLVIDVQIIEINVLNPNSTLDGVDKSTTSTMMCK